MQHLVAIATGLIMISIFVNKTIKLKTKEFIGIFTFAEKGSDLQKDQRNDHSDIGDEDELNPFFRKLRNHSCRKCLIPETEFLISGKNICKQRHLDMSHFSYSCKTEGENGISRLISALCVNCKFTSERYSRIFQNY